MRELISVPRNLASCQRGVSRSEGALTCMRAVSWLRRAVRRGAARAGLPHVEPHLERRAHSRAPKSSSAAWASCEGSERSLSSTGAPRCRSSSVPPCHVQRDLVSSSEHCSLRSRQVRRLPPVKTTLKQAHIWLQANRTPGVSFPYDVSPRRKRPTPGLPHPTVLRLQVFPTS